MTHPYRGLEEVQDGEFRCDNRSEINKFLGSERIIWHDQKVYAPSHAGGSLR